MTTPTATNSSYPRAETGSNGDASTNTVEPFPSLGESPPPASPRSADIENVDRTRIRRNTSTSTLQGRLRQASQSFQESSPPTGFCVATAHAASSIPSLSDIRRGSYGSDGWSEKGQVVERERRASVARQGGSQIGDDLPRQKSINPTSVPEVQEPDHPQSILAEPPMTGALDDSKQNPMGVKKSGDVASSHNESTSSRKKMEQEVRTTPFDNGYQFPPKHSWQESTKIFLIAFWKFFTTPIGFIVTIYGLNVIAWGGMLFLLLCNASPAMCKPTCNDINSPRRIWIEIDSQILNSLFCVTGFGTIPWRFRDLYYLMQYRIQKKEIGLRRLAGINRGWFRLEGSQNLPIELGPAAIETEINNVPASSVAFPIIKIPDAPLTGIRAPPTAMWKLDFVIWTMVWNTFLQAVLSGFMWGFNRYKRPSWSTGLFVALACIVAACGGIMSFVEGQHVKGIEGVPVSEKDQERLKRDNEMGIVHFNNIKDARPKDKKEKKSKGEKMSLKRNQNVEDEVVEQSAMEEGARTLVK
jgi:hypothetical protein